MHVFGVWCAGREQSFRADLFEWGEVGAGGAQENQEAQGKEEKIERAQENERARSEWSKFSESLLITHRDALGDEPIDLGEGAIKGPNFFSSKLKVG